MSATDSPADAAGSQHLGASPTRISTPELRFEAWRALVWTSVVGLVVLAVYISQSLLVVFGALVFASMVDGGARLLGRILPVGRAIRVGIVLLSAVAFFVWLFIFAGSQISGQAAAFPRIVEQQTVQLLEFLRAQGLDVSFDSLQAMAGQAASGVGTVTAALGGLLGGLTTLALIIIIGIYVVAEPRLYERGVAWMLPKARRGHFYETASRMGYTMRRLMFGRLVGMVVEGVFTYAMLFGYGVVTGDEIPMAALLALLTALLAFVPNIGAVISGVLMVLVGFSGGVQMGVYTIIVYFLVQNIDGYLVIPMIAKKTVDLAPALVLAMQLVMGILFGILGLFLADPLLAMLKVILEERARHKDEEDAELDDAAREAPGAHSLEPDPA